MHLLVSPVPRQSPVATPTPPLTLLFSPADRFLTVSLLRLNFPTFTRPFLVPDFFDLVTMVGLLSIVNEYWTNKVDVIEVASWLRSAKLHDKFRQKQDRPLPDLTIEFVRWLKLRVRSCDLR